MTGACDGLDGAVPCGRKVFFLYPHSVLNEDLLTEILSNEYEVYALRDHETAAKLAARWRIDFFREYRRGSSASPRARPSS